MDGVEGTSRDGGNNGIDRKAVDSAATPGPGP